MEDSLMCLVFLDLCHDQDRLLGRFQSFEWQQLDLFHRFLQEQLLDTDQIVIWKPQKLQNLVSYFGFRFSFEIVFRAQLCHEQILLVWALLRLTANWEFVVLSWICRFREPKILHNLSLRLYALWILFAQTFTILLKYTLKGEASLHSRTLACQ